MARATSSWKNRLPAVNSRTWCRTEFAQRRVSPPPAWIFQSEDKRRRARLEAGAPSLGRIHATLLPAHFLMVMQLGERRRSLRRRGRLASSATALVLACGFWEVCSWIMGLE